MCSGEPAMEFPLGYFSIACPPLAQRIGERQVFIELPIA
jgi:hypothetical protein